MAWSKEAQEEDKTKPKWIIKPSCTWKLWWDTLCAVMILIICIAIPYRLSFYSDKDNSLPTYIIAFEVLLLIDMILTFFTAYFQDLELVEDHWSIAKHYFSGWFIIDFLAIVPFFLADGSLLWLKIGRLLQCGRIT